jgi:hypothetical protein
LSRLVQRLRKKQGDNFTATTPTPKTKKLSKRKSSLATVTENTFQQLLNSFLDNKETMKRLEESNKTNYQKLVDYTKENGTRDQNGNRLLQIGDMISHVGISVPTVINVERTSNFLKKLLKRGHINKKEKKEIIKKQYFLKLNEDQYKTLRKQIEALAILPEESITVDEEALKMLTMNGTASVEELSRLYDRGEEKIRFAPKRLKDL